MAHRTTLEADRGTKPAKATKKSVNGGERERTFEAFRRWGYLQANLDPLGFLKPLDYPDLDFSGEIADEARQHYCGSIGADFMHLAQPERRLGGAGHLPHLQIRLRSRDRRLERRQRQ